MERLEARSESYLEVISGNTEDAAVAPDQNLFQLSQRINRIINFKNKTEDDVFLASTLIALADGNDDSLRNSTAAHSLSNTDIATMRECEYIVFCFVF